MRILITNDDGIRADGLKALVAALSPLGEITVVAPEEQKSAVSASITLYAPVLARSWREGKIAYHAIAGTPTDAVKLALVELLPRRPDLIVSGINFGLNTAANVLYSGTVAAALEAGLAGVPAAAFSVEVTARPDWRAAARAVRRLVERDLRAALRPGVVLNVNLPARARPRGVLWTRADPNTFHDRYDRRRDPRGRTYYWLYGSMTDDLPSPALGDGHVPTDHQAVCHGYVSVTPLCRDLTDERTLRRARRR